MPFKKGDFVVIEYTASVKETGEKFDTTLEEIAKEERLYKEGEIYEPKLVVVGEGWVIKELDEKLESLQLRKPEKVEIPPDKAFGPRDPEKLRRIPLRKLREKGITPKLGMRIEYDNKLATIRTLGAGRVTLDFNAPLAGKTLIYDVTVKKKLRTREKKILALIHRRIPLVDIAKFKLNLEKTGVTIGIPEEAFYVEGLQLAKRGIAADVQRFFQAIMKVEFVEVFRRPEAREVSEENSAKRSIKPKSKAKA